MKILAVSGSPRKGNTEFMLGILLDFFNKNGHDTELIELRKKKIAFCSGGDDCCPKKLKCHINDDMLEVYPRLEQADLIILSSPCYFSNVTARMKNFMDRCNPYYYSKKLKNKKFFLLSAGGYEKSVKDSIRCMENFLKGIHAVSAGSYHTVADRIGSIEGNQKVIKELQGIAKDLTK